MDSSLVELAKKGDADAFAALYEQVADDLYRVALYTLGNTHDAQDAVSETFAEAYKGLSSLRENGAFKAWMMRILSVRCKRKIKQYVRERGTVDVDEMLDLSDQKATMDTAVERADILSALSAISPEERQIVLLAVLQGYTTREVAKIVGAPHGTVSSKLHRALKKLRLSLGA